MARIIYAPRARRDLAEVLRYTKKTWGANKAREYRDLVRQALEAIAEDPERGKVRTATRPGILSYHIKQLPKRRARHILFYRVRSGGVIEIVRFLHDAMDFEQHLS